MLIADLIQKLTELQADVGNVPVVVWPTSLEAKELSESKVRRMSFYCAEDDKLHEPELVVAVG